MNEKTETRRYDLDWLRVLAILGIFVFHCTRFFDLDDWSIKNGVTYQFVQVWLEFTNSWGMPLILLISGGSAFLALEKMRPGRYVKGLFLRLFVPLMVGMFTHIAFQIYLERLFKGQFSGSFFAFYPHYFDGMYGFGGNFAWMGLHLWYLELLFIVSLLCLPLFIFLKRTSPGQRLLQFMGDALTNPAGVLLLALPAIYLILKLDEETWGNQSLGGWSFIIYPLFFIGGFVILSNRRLQDYIVRMRWIYLTMGVVFSTAYLFVEFQTAFPALFPVADLLGKVLDCFVVWSWLLAIIGFGMAHLNFTNPFLKYANEGVLPFYILHQTVIISLGYFIIQWQLPDLLKFLVILASSFAVTVGIYHFVVRRVNVLRILFGMKPLPKRIPVGQAVSLSRQADSLPYK